MSDYLFRKSSIVTKEFRNICPVYTDALKTRTCQRCFKSFKMATVTYLNKAQPGRQRSEEY